MRVCGPARRIAWSVPGRRRAATEREKTVRKTLLLTYASLLLIMLSTTGCNDNTGVSGPKGGTAGKKGLLPPLGGNFEIVLEAEDGKLEPDMVVEEFKPVAHPRTGVIQRASGGKCIAVPPKTNVGDKKKNPRGTVTLKFSVPRDGKYYIFPRVWWTDGCSNSLGMIVDQRPEILFTGSTEKSWHWHKFEPLDATSDEPRAFTLKQGEHTLTFRNAEDDVRLDQIYITDRPDNRPAGIMKDPE